MRKSYTWFVLLACAIVAFSGCASFGVWSPSGQQDLTKVAAYYNQYVAGVVKEAPTIIGEAAMILGASSPTVQAATDAVSVAQVAIAGLNKAIQAGTATNTQTDNVQAAINAVNQTIGAVKAVTAPVSTTSSGK